MTTFLPEIKSVEDIMKWTEVGGGMKTNKPFWWKPGVYALISGKTILYIGQSSSVALRALGHPKAKEARQLGYKNIKRFVLETEYRFNAEIELIMRFNPILNKQFTNHFDQSLTI